MAKLYIFGIGGTGSRVLRSLTMLLAAGVDTKGYDVVPIIIDPDSANADLTRNVKLLNKYIEIRSKLSFTQNCSNTFFKSTISQTLPNFLIPIKDTSHKTFEQFINLGGMNREDKAMAQMLFSQKNLSSSMDVGFKGNPNIGSVVLNQITDSDEFKEFANSFTQGDKIFIISSIFGGTGASGFPLLLKTLRQSTQINNAGLINNAEIGAITVLPYFNLKNNDNSEIDSSTFFSKTRAALKYYQDNVSSANVLYFVGDMPQQQYENNEGGNNQQNDANLIEFLAATAIIDFCKQSHQGPISYKEIGLNNNEGAVSLQCLPSTNMRDDFAYPLMRFSLFAKSLVDDFSYVSSNKLKANKQLKKGIYEDEFVKQTRIFLIDYKEWIKELNNNKPSFAPFNIDVENIADLVTDVKGKHTIFSKLDKNTFRSGLNAVKHNSTTDEDKFIETYCVAATKIAKNNYQF